MGIFADSLFTVMMSWVRALVSGIWALFTSDRTTLLGFLGEHWLLIVIAIVAAGLVLDWLVWLVRWQPYHIWALRVRRLLGMPMPKEEESPKARKATAARKPARPTRPREAAGYAQARAARAQTRENWLPLEAPIVDERELTRAMEQADSVPDEQLGAYPGMRYGAHAAQGVTDDTRTFSAVHSEGPGAAEVNRRRAEIDAWRQQMEEEARAKAAEQARLAQEQREAEQARLAQEQYEAEQARLAQEQHEAEQARLAQEEYERQLAEYEIKRAQYERDMEVYRRQKAAYDAEMARRQDEQQAAAQAEQQTDYSAQTPQDYSAYVQGEAVEALPDAPAWPQMPQTARKKAAPKKKKKAKKENPLLSRMAKMLETDEEELGSIHALPPRVSAQDAYRPATKPQDGTRGG